MNSAGSHAAGGRRRDRLAAAIVLVALGAGPFAWIIQTVVSYTLASHACRPGDAPRAAVGWPWAGEPVILVAVNLACLAMTLAAGLVALGQWRRTSKGGAAGRAPPARAVARMRFLAACAMLAALAFSLAILFETPAPFIVPPCWSFQS